MIDPISESTHSTVDFSFSNVFQIMSANGTLENPIFIRGFELNIELTITF